MGILHPGTVFWRSNVVRNWYRNVKYPLIPEKSGRRRGIPREGDRLVFLLGLVLPQAPIG